MTNIITDNITLESLDVRYASWSPMIDTIKIQVRVKILDLIVSPTIEYGMGIFTRRRYHFGNLTHDLSAALVTALERDALAIYKYAINLSHEQSTKCRNKFDNTIVLATNNENKLKEFQRLAGNNLKFIPMSEFGVGDVEETESTYLGNAKLKANAMAPGMVYPVLADDSGIEVFALKGGPGVYSARYAPTALERQARMISELRGETNRAARQVCTLVYKHPMHLGYQSCPRDVSFNGSVDGVIIEEPRGSSGFGYDPIFLHESGKTMAEMTDPEKDEISHRGNAFRNFLSWYVKYFYNLYEVTGTGTTIGTK